VTDFDVTPVHVVFNAIRDEAARAGVEVQGSELIGLIPRKALQLAGSTDFRWERWDDSMVLETRLEMAQAGQLNWPGSESLIASPE
jgi:glutamate formiminotransferase